MTPYILFDKTFPLSGVVHSLPYEQAQIVQCKQFYQIPAVNLPKPLACFHCGIKLSVYLHICSQQHLINNNWMSE